jgi:hypothetical protein
MDDDMPHIVHDTGDEVECTRQVVRLLQPIR